MCTCTCVCVFLLNFFFQLAVSSNAAAAVTFGSEYDIKYNADSNGGIDSEDEYELGIGTEEENIRTTRTDAVTKAPEIEKKDVKISEVKNKTETNATAEVEVKKRSEDSIVKDTANVTEKNTETSSIDNKNGMSFIPFPMNTILKTLSTNALKNLDIGAVCDTVQMMDWKAYQTLIENDDYDGLKEKLENDIVLSSVTETIQESLAKYTKMFLDAKNQGIFEKSLRNLIELLPLEKSVKTINNFDVQKNVKSFIQNLVQEKKISKDKDSMESMQDKMKLLLEMLEGAKSLNYSNSNKVENFGSKGQNF